MTSQVIDADRCLVHQGAESARTAERQASETGAAMTNVDAVIDRSIATRNEADPCRRRS